MPVRSAADLGQLVRAARLRRNLTQAQLAALHGTTQRWISQVESGKDATQLGPALRLLTTLGVVLEAQQAPTVASTKAGFVLGDIVEAHVTKQRPAAPPSRPPPVARKRRGR